MPSVEDVKLLNDQLHELRKLPRALVRNTSTKLTQAAALRSDEPDSRVLLLAARILYVIADETHPDELERDGV